MILDCRICRQTVQPLNHPLKTKLTSPMNFRLKLQNRSALQFLHLPEFSQKIYVIQKRGLDNKFETQTLAGLRFERQTEITGKSKVRGPCVKDLHWRPMTAVVCPGEMTAEGNSFKNRNNTFRWLRDLASSRINDVETDQHLTSI